MKRLPFIFLILASWVYSQSYRHIDTARYRIHYQSGYELMADKIASRVEVLHENICGMLGVKFNDHTEIWINPLPREVNAYSTGIPVNTIALYTNPPWQTWSLSAFGENWLEQVLIHEMTHNIHLNRRRRWVGAASRIFGPMFYEFWKNPDPWNREGFAVWSESTLSKYPGRIDQPLYRSLAAMQAQSGEFPTVYDVNKEPGLWTLGTSYYLYGSLFVDYIEQRWGREKLAEFINRSTGLFPLFKDIPFKRIYGQWPPAIWEDFRKSYAALPVPPSSTSKLLPVTDRTVQPAPFLADSEKIYSVHVSADEPASIRVNSISNGELLNRWRLNGKYSDPDFAGFLSDGRQLLLLSTKKCTRSESRELYSWDGRRMKQITHAGRILKAVRDASTGTYLAMGTDQAKTVFWMLSAEGKLLNTRFEDFADAEVIDFAVSPAGDGVAFVLEQNGRQDFWHSFYRFDISSQADEADIKPLSLAKAVKLTDDGLEKRTPLFSADGQLIFVTPVSNVHQVMSLSVSGLKQLTSEPYGAWYPQVSGTNLYYYSLEKGGYAFRSQQIETVSGSIEHPNGDGFRGVTVSNVSLQSKRSSRWTGMTPYLRYPVFASFPSVLKGRLLISAGVELQGMNIFNDLSYSLSYLGTSVSKSHSGAFGMSKVFKRSTGSFGVSANWVGTNRDPSWGSGLSTQIPIRLEHALGSWGVSLYGNEQTNIRYIGPQAGVFIGNAQQVRRSTFPVSGGDVFLGGGMQTPWLGSQVNLYWLQSDAHLYRRLSSRFNFHTRLAAAVSGDFKKGYKDDALNHFQISSSRNLEADSVRQIKLLSLPGRVDPTDHFTGQMLNVRAAGQEFSGVHFRQAALVSADLFIDIFRFYSVVRFFPWFMFQNISANVSYEAFSFYRTHSHVVHGPLLAFDFRFSSNFKINIGAGFYMRNSFGYPAGTIDTDGKRWSDSKGIHQSTGWTWSVNFVMQ